jgi:hypothetical protein
MSAERTITHGGDTWRVLSEGATVLGQTFCHLASTTRGRQQSNGWMPLQINDWIPDDQLGRVDLFVLSFDQLDAIARDRSHPQQKDADDLLSEWQADHASRRTPAGGEA